ncbi:hypothetical protein QMK22_12040 [Cryobacterium sp. PH29-G1]|nr:hypothetical protein [Cryobacterium sp. PH29-G1]
MSTADPQSPVMKFLATLDKIPPRPGLVFHGLRVDPGAGAVTLIGLVAASRNPRVATENFDTPILLAVLTRTGRDLAPLSGNPAEQETVLLPGTVLLGIERFTLASPAVEVCVVEEISVGEAPTTPTGWPATRDELRSVVEAGIDAAFAEAAMPVASPGKFTADLPL